MKEKALLWFARIIFATSICVFIVTAKQTVGLDSTVIQGLNANLGTVARDTLTHRMQATNLSFSPVILYQEQTCSCELLSDKTTNIAPLRSVSILVRYRIGNDEHGKRQRTVLFYEKRGNSVQKRTGTINFTVN